LKVVLDTNVFISGVFFKGPPHQILNAWRDRKIQILISPDILNEYQEVGERLTSKYSGVDLYPLIELILMNAKLVSDSKLPETVCQDSDDDKFLACAVSGKSRCIVSGDKHLLDVSGYQGIPIVKPSAFVVEYLS